jgi:O-succinylbenzoic acid--CoA ligase
MERVELADALRAWGTKAKDGRQRDRHYIAESDVEVFMSRFAAAVAGAGEIFIGNPGWGETEREAVEELLESTPARAGETGWLMVPTGGTSGGVRFARHDSRTIGAAVQGFTRHFGLATVNAVGALPLHHVSGLMAWLRCALTGGTYLAADWRKIADGRRPKLPEKPDGWVLSLVPTQLERLLDDLPAVEWLRQFRIIFIGGAPSWSTLLERAAGAGLAVSPGYGMTETAAMVAALRPDEFLAGSRSYGTMLPHARIDFNVEGVISVTGESVFRGYYPEETEDRTFETEDIGERDASGRLQVFGRRDGVIITGGEKVHPTEVESVLRGSGEFPDLLVFGAPHPVWGQQVVVAYPAGRVPDAGRLGKIVTRELAAYKHPKLYVPVPNWPVAANGKLRRAEITHYVLEGMKPAGGQPGS